ncbi:MAG: hypothetical protein Kow0068_12890 [Marinilabiliales bacterium]
MKRFYILVLLIIVFGCSKEPSPELLQGKWKIKQSYLMNEVYEGNGSYLEFLSCDSAWCQGIDYSGEDNTTGTFDWSLDASKKLLYINDTLSDGGGYNGTWEILSITNKRLRIKTNTGLFGDITILFKKQ